MRSLNDPRARPDSVVSVLVALGDLDEQAELCALLKHSNWRVYTVSGPAEAAGFLETTAVGVAIVPYRPAGSFSWKDLRQTVLALERPPSIVVTDRLADEAMWAEALSLGAYNILAQPFDRREVIQVLAGAWRNWSGAGKVTSQALTGHAA